MSNCSFCCNRPILKCALSPDIKIDNYFITDISLNGQVFDLPSPSEHPPFFRKKLNDREIREGIDKHELWLYVPPWQVPRIGCNSFIHRDMPMKKILCMAKRNKTLDGSIGRLNFVFPHFGKRELKKYHPKHGGKTKNEKKGEKVLGDVALDRYSKDSQEPLGPEQQDLKKENKIDKQFSKDPSVDISHFKFGTLQVVSSNQDLKKKKHPCKENDQKARENLVNQSNRNSSEGSRKPNLPNAFNVSMHSSMEYNHFFKISRTTNKESLKRKLQGKEIELAGCFTEPSNPGKQMKLGKPYYVHCRVGKDFYKDF